jgi:hypothetical protein
MFKLTRPRAIALGMLSTLAIAGIAFAYWTAGGSGTGSGASAGVQTPLTANQITTLAAMYPGDSPQTISGDFDNPNSGPIRVSTVTASIFSVTKAAGAPAGSCDATDFTLAGAAMTVNAEVPAGNGAGSFTGATIKFNDKAGTSQDACKGASVALAYAIS